MIFFLMLAIATFFMFFLYNVDNNFKEISVSQLCEKIQKGEISKIVVYQKYITCYDYLQNKFSVITSNHSIEKIVFQHYEKSNQHVELVRGKENLLVPLIQNLLWSILAALTFMLIISVFVSTYFASKGEGLLASNLSVLKGHKTADSVSFDNIGGYEKIKKEFANIIDLFKNCEKYKEEGVQLPKGILLYGPPGNGKTLFFKALANELECNYISVCASQFEEVFAGLGASRIRALFEKAAQYKPIVIFIDEIDSFGSRDNQFSYNSQLINQILTCMDGFENSNNILVIAATNKIENLDKALFRNGRFDQKILISYPTLEERLDILKVHCKNKQLDENIDLDYIANKTYGYSASDLATLVNNSALLASKEQRMIVMQDLLQNIEKISKNIEANHITNITFDDVGGCVDAKEDLLEIAQYLNNPTLFEKSGANLSKGIILYGPPGNGKTLLAKAVAGEAQAAFLYKSAADFEDSLVGSGNKNVKKLFNQARQFEKCVIFIDEIDALENRKNKLNSHSRQTINALLTEFDGFASSKNIIVFLATNDIDNIDKALIRSGRVDKKVFINNPSFEDRKEILTKIINKTKIKLDPEVSIEYLAKLTNGMSGADLATLLNESAIKTVMQKNNDVITNQVVFEVFDTMNMGKPSKSIKMNEKERKITAYHEAGHALMAYCFCKDFLSIHKATIVPRGPSLGMVSCIDNENSHSRSKKDYENHIKLILGGMAAEEIIGQTKENISSGPYSDLKSATQIAKNMIEKFGMGSLLFVVNREEISPETAKQIDTEVNDLLKKLYTETLNFIKQHKNEHEIIAKALLEKETLSLKDLDDLLLKKENTLENN